MAEARRLYQFLLANMRVRLDAIRPAGSGRSFAVLGILWPSKKFADAALIPGAEGEGAAALGEIGLPDEALRAAAQRFGELVGADAAQIEADQGPCRRDHAGTGRRASVRGLAAGPAAGIVRRGRRRIRQALHHGRPRADRGHAASGRDRPARRRRRGRRGPGRGLSAVGRGRGRRGRPRQPVPRRQGGGAAAAQLYDLLCDEGAGGDDRDRAQRRAGRGAGEPADAEAPSGRPQLRRAAGLGGRERPAGAPAVQPQPAPGRLLAQRLFAPTSTAAPASFATWSRRGRSPVRSS